MWAHGNAHTLQGALAVAGRASRDRARRLVLPRKIVGIQRLRSVGCRIDTINRHAILATELLVEITPAGCDVGAILTARRHPEIANLEHVSRPCSIDMNGTGHDVRTRAAILRWNARVERLDRRVEHQIGIVPRMLTDGFQLHQVAAADPEHRGQRRIEIAPMNRCRSRPQAMQCRHIAPSLSVGGPRARRPPPAARARPSASDR